MRITKHVLLLMISLLSLMMISGNIYASSFSGGSYNIEKSAMSGGGGEVASARYNLSYTLGQEFTVGLSTGSMYQNFAGLWQTDDVQDFAGVALDADITTRTYDQNEISATDIDSFIFAAIDDEILIAVVAQNVANLDTYQVEVNFDDTLIEFVDGYEDYVVDGIVNFLKQNGGTTVGFQAVESAPGTVNIANALVGTDIDQAPDGSGIIAVLKFKILSDLPDSALTLANVYFVNSGGVNRSIFNTLDATINPYFYPASGSVSYDGYQNGTLYVAAFTDADPGNLFRFATYGWDGSASSQAFSLMLPNGEYTIQAFIDSVIDSEVTGFPPDAWEAQGEYIGSITIDDEGISGIDVSLFDPVDPGGSGYPYYYEKWRVIYEPDHDIGAPEIDYDGGGISNLDEYLNGTDPTDPNDDDEGDPCLFELSLHAVGSDNGGVNEYNVTIGISESADMLPAAPAPPQYSVKMELLDPIDWDVLSRDIRQTGETRESWILAINPHGNVGPPTDATATISWDPEVLCPEGSYKIREGWDGNGFAVVADMRATTSFNVTGGNADQYFTITWGESCVSLSLTAGWNLVSLPVAPDDCSITALFPDVEVAYGFDGTYQVATCLESGKGYWIKVPADSSYDICGQPLDSHNLTLPEGWHLVGGLYGENPVVPASTPDGAIEVMYGFEDTYQPVTELEQGKGYWVKVSQECEFRLEH